MHSLFEPKDAGDIAAPEYSASLRVFSRTLRLSELTERLGPPTKGHDFGEPVSATQGDAHKRTNAAWLLKSSAEAKLPLEIHIEEVISFAEKRSVAIEELRSECSMDIFCGIFRGDLEAPARTPRFVVALACGFTLEPELTRRLAALGLAVGFDIY